LDNKNKAYLLQSDNMECLYINGNLICEGYTLNEKQDRILFFAKLAKQYSFDLIDLVIEKLNDVDNEWIEDMGNFPETMDGFICRYEVD